MKGLTSETERIKHIKVLPKGNTGYINVTYETASFIDSCSFINASLSALVDLKCKNVPPQELHTRIPITIETVAQWAAGGFEEFLNIMNFYVFLILWDNRVNKL